MLAMRHAEDGTFVGRLTDAWRVTSFIAFFAFWLALVIWVVLLRLGAEVDQLFVAFLVGLISALIYLSRVWLLDEHPTRWQDRVGDYLDGRGSRIRWTILAMLPFGAIAAWNGWSWVSAIAFSVTIAVYVISDLLVAIANLAEGMDRERGLA